MNRHARIEGIVALCGLVWRLYYGSDFYLNPDEAMYYTVAADNWHGLVGFYRNATRVDSPISAPTILLALWLHLEPVAHGQELRLKIERYLSAQMLENGFSGQVLIAHGDEVLVNKSFLPLPSPGSDLCNAQRDFRRDLLQSNSLLLRFSNLT